TTTPGLNLQEPAATSIQLLQCPTALASANNNSLNPGPLTGVAADPTHMHAIMASVSITILPLAVTVIRFSVGQRHAWVGIIFYLALYACDLGLGVYGFMQASQISGDSSNSSAAQFGAAHGRMGLAVAVLALVVIPLLSIAVWAATRCIERESSQSQEEG